MSTHSFKKFVKDHLLSPKSLFFVGLLGAFLAFQNCGQKMESAQAVYYPSEAEAEIDCIDPKGQPVADCVPIAPEVDIRTCQVANGIGAQRLQSSVWGDCLAQSCSPGYQLATGVCNFIPVTQACGVANGQGTQTNYGSGFGACTVTTCTAGYHASNNQCVFTPVMRACSVSNGTGIQTNTGSGFGACAIQTCNAGYVFNGSQCAFSAVTQSCAVNNGTGIQTNTGSGFGACTVQSCNSGYYFDGSQCLFVPVTRNCSLSNGTGTQTNYGSGFGACQLVSCNAGYVQSGNSCLATTQACAVDNGSGYQSFSNGAWGMCVAATCSANYQVYNALCVLSSAPVARVNIHILRRSDGSGNELWDYTFLDMMMRYLTSLTLGNVKFELITLKDIYNTADYESLSQEQSSKYLSLRRFTEITAIITNPETNDSAGTAFNIRYNYEPFFAARTRASAVGVDGKAMMAAQIILHELGHNMGMSHDYDKTVNMDTHYYLQPSTLVNYVKGLNACTSERCQCQYSKYSSGSCNDR